MLVSECMVDSYGNTLMESGTDLDMAVDLFRKLKNHIQVMPAKMGISLKEFREWRIKQLVERCNYDPEYDGKWR